MLFSRQSEVEHWERKLYDYRESYFELSARVYISYLVFENRVRPRSGGGIILSLDIELDYRLCVYNHENLITAEVLPDDHRNEAESIRHKFIQLLKERYLNDNRPPDGLIYERINRYEGYLDMPRDPLAANNWWAVLEALVGRMRIGLLYKLTAMYCDEPVVCYWELIFSTFSRLVGGREELLLLIDGVTVELLQSRVPKISYKDLQSL
ncbi:Protein of unknown function DUF3723 [Penicillium roqueforti FM164]|uniref:Uncharacterized protein n=1 Tax=Penicillium roqueforti (strain FM164) TaxID=1365484 RepID=W6Q767_PENRF|nr:Protein of unknown function DUF3723 [Penicillium roqueforti FM164]